MTFIYTAWKCVNRTELLERFTPQFDNVVAHHVTYQFGTGCKIPDNADIKVVGTTTDNSGVQALVVSVNGRCIRSDGGIYHITLSLSDGRKPVESNDVIAEHGWETCEAFILVTTPFGMFAKK
jgi:hypothetical protein